jgi:hypothetical protein
VKQYHFEISPACSGERMIDQYGNPPTTYVPNSSLNACQCPIQPGPENEGPRRR